MKDIKTLVIHPTDKSTDVLSVIYENRGWPVITERIPRDELKELIKQHDRIVMLGHGSPSGLFGHGGMVIDHSFAHLLREKYIVCVWCNSDKYVLRHKLNGFYTGMIISEYGEARAYSVLTESGDVELSNKLFCKAVADAVDDLTQVDKIVEDYTVEMNDVIAFNMKNIYHTPILKRNKPLDILVDFDGTCVTHDYPRIGRDIGAVPVLKALVSNGHKLILFTMRCDTETTYKLAEAVAWFHENDIPLFGIQTNPSQHKWTTSPKAYGQLIIDDIGLGTPLKYDPLMSNRNFVDWVKVKEWLTNKDLI